MLRRSQAAKLSTPRNEMIGFTYILTNKNHTVLYVGSTSDLLRRLSDHQQKKYSNSFTAKYNVEKLVYYKCFESLEEARKEEMRIKGGSRAKKIQLIEGMNCEWKDLKEKIQNLSK